MNLLDAQQFAESKLHDLGLVDWKFAFDHSVKRFGCCQYGSKTITLSKHLTLLNEFDRVKNTILHEIAHILAGPIAGHNWRWREQAKALGCDGQRCYSDKEVVTVPLKWKGTCEKCGHTFYRQRRVSEGAKMFHRQDHGLIHWSRNV